MLQFDIAGQPEIMNSMVLPPESLPAAPQQ